MISMVTFFVRMQRTLISSWFSRFWSPLTPNPERSCPINCLQSVNSFYLLFMFQFWLYFNVVGSCCLIISCSFLRIQLLAIYAPRALKWGPCQIRASSVMIEAKGAPKKWDPHGNKKNHRQPLSLCCCLPHRLAPCSQRRCHLQREASAHLLVCGHCRHRWDCRRPFLPPAAQGSCLRLLWEAAR
jgi:hypothetical protein